MRFSLALLRGQAVVASMVAVAASEDQDLKSTALDAAVEQARRLRFAVS